MIQLSIFLFFIYGDFHIFLFFQQIDLIERRTTWSMRTMGHCVHVAQILKIPNLPKSLRSPGSFCKMRIMQMDQMRTSSPDKSRTVAVALFCHPFS